MIEEKEILHRTHYGVNIYAHILHEYYPNEIVLELSGKQCKMAKNPFNADRRTLDISSQDWIFNFQDTEILNFKGNPFDFAAHHYKLEGQELLQKINEELHLHIGEVNEFYGNHQSKVLVPEQPTDFPKFSFYKCPISNTQPYWSMTIPEMHRLIKSSEYKQRTEELRNITNSDLACRYKRSHFDYVTFSGVFSKRGDAYLRKPSGLLTLDFDHVSYLRELKETLLHDQSLDTVLLFYSPSGNGLKWIIPVDLNKCTYQEWFAGVSGYLKQKYQLEVDKSGKDISRACFLPHDPEVYINPKYLDRT